MFLNDNIERVKKRQNETGRLPCILKKECRHNQYDLASGILRLKKNKLK